MKSRAARRGRGGRGGGRGSATQRVQSLPERGSLRAGVGAAARLPSLVALPRCRRAVYVSQRVGGEGAPRRGEDFQGGVDGGNAVRVTRRMNQVSPGLQKWGWNLAEEQ